MEKITIKDQQGSTSEHTVNSYDDVSDGYHSIGELYEHRLALYVALCKNIYRYTSDQAQEVNDKEIWRAKVHHDGTSYEGWFLMGIGKAPGKQITYHLPLSWWEETNFAPTFDKAPVPFDGHTSADVKNRLKDL